MTSEEDYIPLIKTPSTLRDYIPKGFFRDDSSDDNNTLKDVAV